MTKKSLLFTFLLSMMLWVIPFIIRLFINDSSLIIQPIHPDKQNLPSVVTELFASFSHNDRGKAFHIIFNNNMKVCLYNIVGGVMLGLGTFINLIMNGFLAADTFVNIHKSGMSISDILKYTLPHSFEIIGVWLSGLLGFIIAKIILDFIRFNKLPTVKFYKYFGFGILITLCIILAAAYTEAFVSLPANYGKFFIK